MDNETYDVSGAAAASAQEDSMAETIMVEGRFIRDIHAHLDKAMTARRATLRRDSGASPLYDTDEQWRLVEDVLAITGNVVRLMDQAVARARAEIEAQREEANEEDEEDEEAALRTLDAIKARIEAEIAAKRRARWDESARGPAGPPTH